MPTEPTQSEIEEVAKEMQWDVADILTENETYLIEHCARWHLKTIAAVTAKKEQLERDTAAWRRRWDADQIRIEAKDVLITNLEKEQEDDNQKTTRCADAMGATKEA